MVHWVENLLCKHSDLSSDASTYVKSQKWLLMAVISAFGAGGQEDLWASPAANLNCFKQIRQRAVEEDTQCPLLYIYMQRVHTNTDMGVGVDR